MVKRQSFKMLSISSLYGSKFTTKRVMKSGTMVRGNQRLNIRRKK